MGKLSSAINVLSGLSVAGEREWRARPWLKDYFITRDVSRFVKGALSAEVRPGSQVLDVGCGDQPYRQTIEQWGGTYVGVDVEQNLRESVSVLSPADRLPLPDTSFDVIVCTEVLEHVGRLDQALGEIARVLKPGGKLIITCPFSYPLHLEPNDFQRLTPHAFHRLASDNNLSLVLLVKAGNEISVLFTLIDHIFTEQGRKQKSLPEKVLHGIIRLVINAAAIPLEMILGKTARQNWYTHNLVILEKR